MFLKSLENHDIFGKLNGSRILVNFENSKLSPILLEDETWKTTDVVSLNFELL